MKKRFFAFLLAFAMSIYFCPVNYAANGATTAKEATLRYNLSSIKRAEVLDMSRAGSVGLYKTLQIGQDIVYSFEDKSNGTEYAYCDASGNVHYARYEGEELVETKVYTDQDFQTREQTVSVKVENTIDKIVREHPFATAAELQREFAKAGLSNVDVTEENGAILINPFSTVSTFAATKAKNIGLDGLTRQFPTMSKKAVASKTFNAKPEPVVSTKITCKDTRNSYSQVKQSTSLLSAGMSVVVAAAKVYINPTNLLAILGLASSITKLVESCNFTRGIRAKASVMRQAWMYDRTNYKRDVSVYTEYGTDYFSVGKASDSSPYGWYAEYQSLFDEYTTTSVLNDGINAWQTNMDLYGYWMHGDV